MIDNQIESLGIYVGARNMRGATTHDKKRLLTLDKLKKNAIKRDLEIEQRYFEEEHNGIDQETVDEALKVLSKATGGKEIYIGTKKSPQSKVRFAQFLQKNWEFLRKEKYLTSEEKIFFN
ncbi:hypothetical protein ACT7DN_30615 [Bacillus paranthracis]